MPFTFSHPAAILPLHKWSKQRGLLYPLVIGSMMPDFGYYFAPTEYFELNAHTLLRSFTFCLPMGLICLTLLYALRNAWPELIPSSKGQAFAKSLFPEKYNLALIIKSILAIVIGAWTHILWDSFTHKTGFMLPHLRLLNFEVFPNVQVFRILQHLSSLIGAICLIVYYRGYEFVQTERKDYTGIFYFWFTANAISLIVAFKAKPFNYFNFITSFISCFIMIMFIRSIFIAVLRKR